ncbi:hypothetical protein AB0G35_36170 [Streptomyces sp. NPDC021749]|uniref:hypothetical protein n=1 Tax=Streptomyces sp. NPDC021749 TaxID=3154905 RepID=UPI0033EC42C8
MEWISDWDYAMEHVMSRRLLMREYLRRAALWARAYSAEDEWPFFDVTERIDPEFRLSPEIAAELNEFLGTVPEWFLRNTCAGAVRMAELRIQNKVRLPDLPDLYEPLVLFYERGGEFVYDNAGGLDLTGVSFRPKGLQSNLGSASLVALRGDVLDALDAKGRISFYATADGRPPVLRRRLLPGGERHDEAFGQDLRWEPTDRLPGSEEEAKEAGWVRITDNEAAQLIEEALVGTPS